MAVPSALSACMGITEPAIFGVNIRFGKPFIMGCLGGACGALFASISSLGATGTGVTGIFGILLCLNNPVGYILMFAIAFGVAFVLTWMFGYKDEVQETAEKILKQRKNQMLRQKLPRRKLQRQVHRPSTARLRELRSRFQK